MSEVTYQVERFQDCAAEGSLLWHAHLREVGADSAHFTLDPDIGRYCAMQDAGQLCIVTARKFGKLIGYHCSTVTRHLHYNSKTAYTDVFYIDPLHRKGPVGIRLFKEAEKALIAMGVERIYSGTKLKLDIGPILERLGYNPIERVYTKVVKDKHV